MKGVKISLTLLSKKFTGDSHKKKMSNVGCKIHLDEVDVLKTLTRKSIAKGMEGRTRKPGNMGTPRPQGDKIKRGWWEEQATVNIVSTVSFDVEVPSVGTDWTSLMYEND